MLSKPTDELNNILENTKPEELDLFFKENREYMIDDKKAFYHYMRNVLDEKNIKLKDVYSFAGVTESYGSQILRMEKHTANRDMIIRLCIAGHLNLIEIKRALKYYGMRELYSKDPRDVCLIAAVNSRKYNLAEIDDILVGRGYKKLSKDE